MYDIIYSLGCHEAPDTLIDMLENIFYFNKSQTICIILNCNNYMYQSLKDNNYIKSKPVFINSKVRDKMLWTYDIIETHLDNIRYCNESDISATYIIPLASNCMFHKQITMRYISDLFNNSSIYDTTIQNKVLSNWHWPQFLKNTKINEILNKSNIYNYIGNQHEGIIIPYNIASSIYSFCKDNKIKENIECNTVFEEIILPTLYAYYTSKYPSYICYVFWDSPNYTPTIQQIEIQDKPCVKRVQRSMNDPVRQWLKNLRK